MATYLSDPFNPSGADAAADDLCRRPWSAADWAAAARQDRARAARYRQQFGDDRNARAAERNAELAERRAAEMEAARRGPSWVGAILTPLDDEFDFQKY